MLRKANNAHFGEAITMVKLQPESNTIASCSGAYVLLWTYEKLILKGACCYKGLEGR